MLFRILFLSCATILIHRMVLCQQNDSVRFITSAVIGGVPTARSLSILDCNNDGRNDLAVGVWGPFDSDEKRMQIFLQLPDGSLSTTPIFGDSLLYASDMQAVDIDNDQQKDLVVADGGVNGITIFSPDPSGIMKRRFVKTGMRGCASLRVADVNGDSLPDIITIQVQFAPPDQFDVFYQNPDGSFAPPRTYPLHKSIFIGTSEYTWTNIQSSDMNGDGLNDVIISGGEFDKQISIFHQTIHGDLAFSRHLAFPTYVRNIAIGDFTNDGRNDIVAPLYFLSGIGSQIALFAQTPEGEFVDHPEYFPAYELPITVFSGDLDLDGTMDILATHANRFLFTYFRHNAGTKFEPYTLIPTGNRDAVFQSSLAIGDLNGDHKADIASLSPMGSVYVETNISTPPLNPVPSATAGIPGGFSLAQNYPNPFNDATVIHYRLRAKGNISLSVHDVLGHTVTCLTAGEQSAGEHQAVFHAAGLSSGIYFYRLMTDEGMQIKKMLYIR